MFKLNKILVLFLFFCNYTLAQETFFYKNYTTDDGLPTNTVYKIKEDTNGNIILGTDNGLSIFNGTTFQNYNVSDGLSNPYVTSLYVTPNNVTYFGCYGGYVGKFSQGKISTTNTKAYNSFDLFVDTNKMIVSSSGFVQVYSAPQIYFFKIPFKKPEKRLRIEWSEKDRFFLGLHQNKLEIKVKYNTLFYNDKTVKVPDSISEVYKVFFRKNDVCILSKTKVWFVSFGGKIIKSVELPEAIYTDKKFYCFIVDSYDNLWYSKHGIGLFKLSSNDKWEEISDYIGLNNEEHINDIFCDSKGRIWLATHQKGLFSIPNYTTVNYVSETSQSYFESVASIEDYIVFSSMYKLYGLHNNQIQEIKFKNNLFDVKLFTVNEKTFALTTNKNTNLDTENKFVEKIPVFNGNEIIVLNENKYLVLGRGELHIYSHERGKWSKTLCKINHKEKEANSQKNRKIIYHKNKLYLSKENKIYVLELKENEATEIGELSYLKDVFISDFEFMNDTLLVAFEDKLYKYYNNKLTGVVDKINDKKLSSIVKIKVIANEIWILTINGLIKCGEKESLVINKYNFLEGNEVTDFLIKDGMLYVTSKKGFSRFAIKDINQNKRIPKVEVKEVQTASKEKIIGTNIALTSREDYANILLNIQNFNSVKNQILEYKIDKNKWNIINGDELSLSTISYGDHTVTFRIKDVNSTWSYTSVHINRAYPFYYTWWFIVASCLLALGLIWLIIRYRIAIVEKKKKEEIEINNKIVELRQSALSAMMNPHFVFNSLNAIQYYINSNQKQKSSEYLASLSRLVRMFLMHASEPFISLEEEIKRLKLYIELEHQRFSNFKYSITISPKIKASQIKIPNMIIQPFVENAIMHGLSHLKTNDGELQLNMEINNNTLNISVIDNGFGVDLDVRKNNSHVSKGISIIQERLNILQANHPNKTYVLKQHPVYPNSDRKGHKVALILSTDNVF